MRTLKEQFAAELANIPDRPNPSNLMTQDVVSSVLEPFSGEPYGELGAIIGMLEGLSVLMQTFHWKTNGDSFFGDHSIYQRIYEGIDAQTDQVGEKAVGLGSSSLVSDKSIVESMDVFLLYVRSNSSVVHGSADAAESFMRRARYAEEVFIETVEKFITLLTEQGSLTKGLDNLLGGILDQHEGYAYLLKQRVAD